MVADGIIDGNFLTVTGRCSKFRTRAFSDLAMSARLTMYNGTDPHIRTGCNLIQLPSQHWTKSLLISRRSDEGFFRTACVRPICQFQTSLTVSFGSAGLGLSFSLTSPARRSLSSSGVPFLQAQASTKRRVSRFHSLVKRSNRIGTSMITRTGKAGAAFVRVMMKITIVTTIWTAV